MKDLTPTWHREATTRGINFIVLVYEKAEGFVFCPTNLEKPFRVGGDYNGSYPTDAAGANSYYSRYFNQAFINRVEWFIPFVEKVERGEDFSLDDLELNMRSNVRLIEGKWPW